MLSVAASDLRNRSMTSKNIPEFVADKANTFPEYTYGTQHVNLVLRSGEIVKDVILAWGREIVKISGRNVTNQSELWFRLEDVVDVRPYDF